MLNCIKLIVGLSILVIFTACNNNTSGLKGLGNRCAKDTSLELNTPAELENLEAVQLKATDDLLGDYEYHGMNVFIKENKETKPFMVSIFENKGQFELSNKGEEPKASSLLGCVRNSSNKVLDYAVELPVAFSLEKSKGQNATNTVLRKASFSFSALARSNLNIGYKTTNPNSLDSPQKAIEKKSSTYTYYKHIHTKSLKLYSKYEDVDFLGTPVIVEVIVDYTLKVEEEKNNTGVEVSEEAVLDTADTAEQQLNFQGR